MKQRLLAIALFIVTTQIGCAQVASLDSTFGSNGKVLTSFTNWDAGILSTEIQSDGKIVVCGYRSSLTSTLPSDTIIGRYNPDGSVDTAFGTNGFIIITNLFVDGAASKLLLIQSDGKIVVTGSRSVNANFGNLDFYTYRFNTNGTLDTTFGANGIVITDINTSQDEATTVIAQPDGKLVVAGIYLSVGDHYFCAVRYNTDGSLDTAFGTNGKAIFGSLAPGYEINTMDALIDTDGKILFGLQNFIFNVDYNFALVRLNSDGTLDTSFGTNGITITDFGNQDRLTSIQKINNNYYAFGFSSYSNGAKMALAKYDEQGILESTFGTNGKILLHRNATAVYDFIADTKVVGNKILCAGYGDNDNQSVSFNADGLLIQFNLDGSIDTTFNTIGYTMIDFVNNGNDFLPTMEIQADGKLIAAGYTTIASYDNFAIARYNLVDLANNNFTLKTTKVYPNPFTSSFTIEDASNAIMELYDITGKKLDRFVSQYDDASYTVLTSQQLPKGNYFLKITTDKKTEIIKVIKQ
jgi:uncharacterized delta-60 repeat protein